MATRTLKGRKPAEVIRRKPMVLMFGLAGVGKTWWATAFPKLYFIDTENGATQPEYIDRLKDAVYFGVKDGAQDFASVTEEVKTLATVRHDRRTLVIDSFTKLYNIECGIAEADGGSDFGRDKKEANKPTRELLRWLEKLDMTVILLCHERDVWGQIDGKREVTGQTFEGYAKLDYELDLVMRAEDRGGKRVAVIKKSRMAAFPPNDSFTLSFDEFSKRYGENAIQAEAEPVVLATDEQVGEIVKLIGETGTEQRVIDKWLNAANAAVFPDMNTEQIGKCIELLKSKTKGAA